MKSLLRVFLVFLLIPTFFVGANDKEESIELIYQKLNSLQKEMADLRSLIEENTYLIERYQELQQLRYVDLDKRLHDLISKELEAVKVANSPDSFINESNESLSQEINLYKQALELFDDARYSEALSVFREQIISYPEGTYSADAYFWCGELFLIQEKLEDARENYLVVIQKFIEHVRASDSLYKLGLIERSLGKEEDAIVYFSRILEEFPNTGAALLAEKAMKISQ